jgi:hypothetical protein
MRGRADVPEREAGFALILAILALMLMTFLGLTLATSTSTELQIATNYRYAQQAYYNAEAGIEFGKSLLRVKDWTLLLPNPRSGGSDPGCGPNTPPTPASFKCWFMDTPPPESLPLEDPPYANNDIHGNPTRNFENSQCDTYGGGMGYGVVLDDGGAFGPYQNVTNVLPGIPPLNGSFTLWIRRELAQNDDASFTDSPDSGELNLILTSEGTAPYTGETSALAFTQQSRAVKVLQATLSRTLGTPCGTRGGQVGGGPEGSNFSPCDPITGDSLTNAIGGGTRVEAQVQ